MLLALERRDDERAEAAAANRLEQALWTTRPVRSRARGAVDGQGDGRGRGGGPSSAGSSDGACPERGGQRLEEAVEQTGRLGRELDGRLRHLVDGVDLLSGHQADEKR